MNEICDMHARVVANLRLGMNVFLNADLKSAQRLLATKVELRQLQPTRLREEFANGDVKQKHA
jgi:phosphate:Na+ symporter